MARCRNYVAIFFVCLIVLLPVAVASSQAMVPVPGEKAQGKMPPATQALGGDDRFLTYVSTDKPIYRGGEKVFVRGVMLKAADRKPISDDKNVSALIKIRGPKGDIVSTGNVRTENSVWGYEWTVPVGQSGGEYTVLSSYPWNGYAPAERKFDIRAFRAPRLNSHITFLRDGYGPGEKVTASLEVKRAEGGVPAGAKVTVNARVDGIAVTGASGLVDDKGMCTVSFDLPREIPRGEGTLALAIQDGGVFETASKTIPILLQTVDVQVYPEGGDLVGGFKNRVYLQANQPDGKPADIEGYIVSDEDKNAPQSKAVATFRTEHEGRGRFEFTPNAELQYFLKISKPVGITKLIELPEVKPRGTVISANQEVYKKGQPISVQVGSSTKKFRVTVAKREVELASTNIDLTDRPRSERYNLSPVSLTVPADADGVLSVTVWDEKGLPLAERLVFHEPAESLHVSISADHRSYVPGEGAKVTVKTTDAGGKPVSAVVGLTVTDESVLQMIEKREQAPRLPVMVFLEPEVKDLADARVYLDAANPKAPLDVDLLLGTQGWRRFAFVDVNKFVQQNGDAARRVVALKSPASGRILSGRIGEFGGAPFVSGVNMRTATQLDTYFDISAPGVEHKIGRVERPREANFFQVEPTVIDERHYTSGRAERHQKTSPTLPEGAPIPDNDGFGVMAGAGLASVDRYSFFPPPPSAPQVVVREFAHQVRKDRKPGDRLDFAETLYWNTGVKTDAKTGEATVNFGLNDSVTTFQVNADAFSSGGAIGAASLGLKSVQPFYAEAKLPLEVTTGDRILLPLSLVNATDTLLKSLDLHFDVTGPLKLKPISDEPHDLGADKRVRCLQPIDVGFGEDPTSLTLQAKAGAYQDKVTRKLSVKSKGFPEEKAFGGMLEPGKKISLKINIEKNLVPGSMSSSTLVFPSPLASLTGALERMIQDPCGCFEQTSSTSYPLTMAQQYFLSHTGVAPSLIEASREKLDKGYKQLVGFWCPDRGYEWFGENPGHEALTAFGLLHFNDMSQVREVDRKMVSTTREWLMKQKDGQGGFNRKRRALHTWIEDKDCSNAYIVWALLETGESPANLTAEIAALKTTAAKSQNSYVLALAANALYLAGDKAEAKQLMKRLASLQKSDGSVEKITASIVGSGGESLEVEGTSLAALAWLRDSDFNMNVERTIKYLADSCKAGRFGSTQATVLALRTIVSYDKKHAAPKEPGKLRIYVDEHPIGDWVAFGKTTQESIKLPDLSEVLTAGDHTVQIEMVGGSPMPYSMAAKYKIESPISDKDCKLALQVKMAQDKVVEGTSTEADVTVQNISKEAVP
ncbi:MAG: A-macroglobulin complement component, partial [Cyanobacteria bacterium SZAS LIN-2]|nr:A-macroglobulin complement component [Cyanobacteria bacterium SZAS LIN-2]